MNPEESYPSERELELEAEYYEDKSLREREDRDDMIKKGRDNFGGKYKKLQPPKQSCPQCKTEYTKEELLTNEHCFKCGFEMKGF